MDKLFAKNWPFLALTALWGVAVLREASGNPLRYIFAGVNQDGQDNVFGIDNSLLFVLLGAVLLFVVRQGKRRKTDEEEEDLKRNIPELCVTLKEQVKNLHVIAVNMTKIQELERKLKETEDCKKKEELGNILRFTKQHLEHQALEDKIRCLEDQKNLLGKQMAAYERSKAELEEKLLQIKEENRDVKKYADEMAQRNDNFNNQVMSLTADLAESNCRLVQLQTVADKMHKNLCRVTEEKMEMEKHIQAQAETINRCKNDKEEMQLKVEDLQKEVRFLSQAKQNLECQLQEKDTRLRKQNALLQERHGRLQEMEEKANAIDGEYNGLQDKMRQLQREKEQCLRDLENVKMQKKQQEETNTRLQQQISLLMRWREGVAFGLRKTDDQLANGAP
ncbi:probable DNA double-strand break repair Rad50 ATPase [Palaemon carinicauda]|uniref:probable DNA double-strand break repair Rad50 ATPase n=1 Tax=Palaemon carinicauda TaxID=392227 RepID=UPI0035B694A8